MITISKTYTIKYEVSFAPEYKFLSNNECYNSKTGRILRKVLNSGCIGYIIRGKFVSLTKLRSNLIKPKDTDCPF